MGLTAGRLRTLLAMLAISAGETVSVDRLAAGMWDGDLPGDVRSTVQTYVTRLRGVLGAELIGTRPTGYALHAAPDQVDALRFLRLLDAAAAAPDVSEERARLGEALALWRGTPFEGVRSAWLEHTESRRLVERYLAAVERRIDLAEQCHGDLVPWLGELVARHPLRESLWVRLLVVLARCGRQAEALQRYETVRARLAEELGTDPGAELQRVFADLLAGRAPERPDGVRSAPLVPRQLPRDGDRLTGREAALATLGALFGGADGPAHQRMTICVIWGLAGVGKTALAVHVAHRLAERFADGQLYVDLQGATVGLRPLAAVRQAVATPGVPAELGMQLAQALFGFFWIHSQQLRTPEVDQVRDLLAEPRILQGFSHTPE